MGPLVIDIWDGGPNLFSYSFDSALFFTNILPALTLLLVPFLLITLWNQRRTIRCLETQSAKIQITLDTTEKALALSESLFRNMTAVIPHLVWISSDDGKIQFLNNALNTFLQSPATFEEAASLFQNRIHPDDLERVLTQWRQCLQSEQNFDAEYRLNTDDGYRWFYVLANPCWNYRGDVTHWIGSCSDINDRVEALRQAFAAEQKLRSMINSLPIFMWSIDRNGICDFCEGRALQKLGLKPGQLVGCRYTDYFKDDDEAHSNYARALAGESFSTIRLDSSTMFEIHYSPQYNANNENVGIVGIGVDITALHLAKVEQEKSLVRERAMLEASRLKSEFLANMSHEIRTPLNGIIGMGRLLQETDINSKQLPMVKAIEVCSDALLHIVNDVLDISKIEAGKLLLEQIPFNLIESLTHIKTIVAIKAQEKGLALIFETAFDVSRHVMGDEYRFRQILINVLSNAVKFTETGVVRLSCEATELNSDTYQLNFVISDTGIGMSAEQTDRIFHTFAQADESTTRRFGGTGLGLSIAKNLCEAMGGHISVKSQIGHGSQFVITLNLGRTCETDIRSVTAEQNTVAHVEHPLSVLVAEDNEINCFLIQSYLSKLQLESEAVADGEALLAKLERASYDVILMDIHMPKVDGIMATRMIRARRDLKKQPYIIAITASVLLEDKAACLEAGMNATLSKPVTLSQLATALNAVAQSGRSILTRDDVFNNFEGDADIFAQLVLLFHEQVPKIHHGLQDAIDRSDFPALIRLAHTLRGSLSLFTTRLAAPWAEAIEASAYKGDIESVRASFLALVPELEELARLMNKPPV
ncbi:MAG: response regulator [Chitinophagaceae bacterium]|nr:response regulator [Oligoflexus sp.]